MIQTKSNLLQILEFISTQLISVNTKELAGATMALVFPYITHSHAVFSPASRCHFLLRNLGRGSFMLYGWSHPSILCLHLVHISVHLLEACAVLKTDSDFATTDTLCWLMKVIQDNSNSSHHTALYTDVGASVLLTCIPLCQWKTKITTTKQNILKCVKKRGLIPLCVTV